MFGPFHGVMFCFPLTTLILWAAILLYDYCLTLAAEVERCWGVRRFSFSSIQIMMEFFWITSNSNKTEVSILLLKIPSLRVFVFIHPWQSKMAINLIISFAVLAFGQDKEISGSRGANNIWSRNTDKMEFP